MYYYNKLAKLLKKKRMSETALKKAAALSDSDMWNLETGRPLSVEGLSRICLLFECDVHDILESSDDPCL